MNEEQLALVKYRQKGDYMEQAEVTQSDIDEMVLKATDFVNKVKGYLRLPDIGQ